MIHPTAQRVVLALLAGAPTLAQAQDEAAAALWRLAATTVPLPAALAVGSPSAFWNPAQQLGRGRAHGGLEFVQAPAEVGASGMLAAMHVSLGRIGHAGLVYGRMRIDDLVRTIDSPDPLPGSIQHDTHTLGLTWTRGVIGATVGATVAYHQNRLDEHQSHRWTMDVGVRHRLGDVVRLAAATHFLSPGPAAARDVYGALGLRIWHGALWPGSGEARLELRYGVAVAHGFAADHQTGLGFDLSDAFGADLLVGREGGYGGGGWRPAAGLRVTIGRYRVTVARDAGTEDIGSAFRIGLEARVDD
ncbi:MAG TPA: hypothetical protein VGA20_01105 [Gemmatimonadales bacterium]